MARICHECGSVLGEDDKFCTRCGAIRRDDMPWLDDSIVFELPGRIQDRLFFLAMILAVVPGMFDIFGLGHLFLRKWLKGALLALSSLALMYLSFAYAGDKEALLILGIVSVAIYIIQFTDLLIGRLRREKV